jgi:hypothetical protein
MEPWRRPARVVPDPDAADEVPMPQLNVPNLQNRPTRTREARWLLAGCLLSCVPSAGPGPQNAEPKAASPKPQPLQAELRASPPPPAPVSSGNALALAAPPPPPPPDANLECVNPPDPELDKETSWSRELGQLIERRLPSLRRCTADMPGGEDGSITLRLVYQKDGTPLSQHVVGSTPNACAASECLKQELSSVRASSLFIDRGAMDVTLSLSRNSVPQRTSEPVDPLAQDDMLEAGVGCIDADVARLSQSKVREVVSSSFDGLQNCYSQALVRNHAATGKVTFEFVIGQNGGVPEAWARDATLQDCEAITCMLSQFRSLSFPEPVGRSVRVIYPISYIIEQQPVSLR